MKNGILMKKNNILENYDRSINPEELDSIKNSIFNKYLEIKQDILNNIDEVFNRFNYYTKKYRGNLLTNINVGIILDEYQNKTVQIYIKHKNIYIKDSIHIDKENKIQSKILTNIYE